MANITPNPIFRSFSGKLGNVVLYERNGKQFARIHVIPKNPDTEEQRKTRTTFSGAVSAWQSLSIEKKQLWNSKAAATGKRGYNLFLSEYIKGNVKAENSIIEPVSYIEKVSEAIHPAVFSSVSGVPLRCSWCITPLVPAFDGYDAGSKPAVCNFK